jgi:glutamate/tyrosine decarboxylase-like PLP-dependent enzyme
MKRNRKMSDEYSKNNFFLSPFGENRKEVEQILTDILKTVVTFFSQASSHSPLPVSSVQQKELSIPEQSLNHFEIKSKIKTMLSQSMNPASPTFIGHMSSLPTVYSVLAEMLTGFLNNNMLFLELSPFLTKLEYSVLNQFCSYFNLPEGSGGVLTSGGSLANIQALTLARNVKLDMPDGDLSRRKVQAVLFASEYSHSSLQKAAMVLGLGKESVRVVSANENAQMDVVDLEREIINSKGEGSTPFCIVATAGTTISGNIDPLAKIQSIALKYNLWFHVDAIYAGALVFSPENKYRIKGIELADSISFNPHKWLYVTQTCSMCC